MTSSYEDPAVRKAVRDTIDKECRQIPDEVRAMLDDPQAPTAPWKLFAAAMKKDDTIFWRVSCGHHLNLFEQLLDAYEDLLTTYEKPR